VRSSILLAVVLDLVSGPPIHGAVVIVSGMRLGRIRWDDRTAQAEFDASLGIFPTLGVSAES